jgi:hypothetical protein
MQETGRGDCFVDCCNGSSKATVIFLFSLLQLHHGHGMD